MACIYLRTDEDGQVRQSPVHSRIIQYVDKQLASGEIIDATRIIGHLADAGVMGRFNGRLHTEIDNDALQDIVELNSIFQLNYGISTPPIKLVPVERMKGVEIAVVFDENMLNTAQFGVAPRFVNQTVAYDFAYQKQIRSEGFISPVIRYTGDPRPKMIADPNARFSIPSQITAKAKMVFNPNLLDIAIAESKMTRESVDSILARFDQENKDSRLDPAGMDEVDIQDLSNQISRMKMAFENAGIPIQIEIDPELEVKGRVVSTPGKMTVIKLNPLKITEDTAIHEFGHVLVELLGEDNVTIKKAIEELRGTNLYKQVQEKYPELNGKKLDIEVLVTAIGITGAKIERKNPNKFQTIVNRIFRALAKLFGVEASPSAIESLAQMLLKDKIDSRLFKGSISHLMADSKSLSDAKKEQFDNVLTDAKIAIQDFITKVERQGETADPKVLARLEIMQNRLKTAKKIEDLRDFVDYAVSLTDRATEVIDEVQQMYNPDSVTAEQRLEIMHKLQTIGGYVNDFFGGKDPSKSVMTKISNLVSYKIRRKNTGTAELEADPEFQALTELEKKIVYANKGMSEVEAMYSETYIPILADLLMEYNNDDIEDEINKLIDNIKTNKRLVAIERDAEYKEIKKKYSEGLLTKIEFDAAMQALNIKQLENKKINRATLIRELTEAQRDKSAFSYLIDPIIYSSQVGLQMFAKLMSDKMYQANDDTQADIYKVAEAYRAYEKSVGGSVNPVTFNEFLLETHEYRVWNNVKGEMETMSMLSFVQPHDVTKYKKAEQDMYDSLDKKYHKPVIEATGEEFKVWAKSDYGKAYYAEVSKWYSENSEPSEDSKERLLKLLADKDKYKSLAATATSADYKAKYEQDVDLINSMISKIYDPTRKQFKYTAVRPNAKYANPKYEALKRNPAAFTYYEALLDMYKSKQKTLGDKTNQVRNSWDNFSYIAPSIRNEGLEKVQKNGAWQATRDAVKDKFSFLSTDTSYGEAINANRESTRKVIPIFFVNPMDEKFVTRDLASSIVQFAGMTNVFKRKSEINSAVIMMRDAIENRKVTEVNSAGHPIIHRYAKKLNFVRHETKDGKDSNNFKHLSEFIDTIFYGEEDLKVALDVFGKEISANKLAGQLSSFTALNNLAFNLLQSVNQLVIDNARLVEEGVAGQFFNKKNLAWAKKMYYSVANGGMSSLKDFESFAPKSKLVQAIQHFDALGEVLQVADKKKSGPKALKAVNDIPMVLQKIAEHETAVTRMFALMDTYTGKLKDKDGNVIKNKDGKDANLWDVFILDEKTGRYGVDPKVANFNRMNFIHKISGLTKKTNQVKSKLDRSALERRAGGKLMMLFRRYFVSSLRRNFGHNGLRGGIHRDLELGVVSEGMLSTFRRFITDSISNKGNVVKSYKNMTDMEKQNMKRVFVQMGFLVLCSLIVALLGTDDDDEETYGEQFLMYQALRMQSELTQFINPMEFVKLAVSPTATVRPLERAYDLLIQTWVTGIGTITGDDEGLYYERRSGLHEQGDSKLVADIKKLIPIWGGLEKSFDPESASKWFDLGASSGK